eukprot:2313082-Rhodomonas_salina.1
MRSSQQHAGDESVGNEGAHLLGDLGGRGEAGADGPDRLVGDGHALHLSGGDAGEALGELESADSFVELRLVLVLGLADAQDGLQPGAQHLLRLE